MVTPYYLPVLQVRQDCILGYMQYQFTHRPPPQFGIRENIENSGVSGYSGLVKTAAARRLLAVVDVMIQSSRVRMVPRPGGKVFPFRLGFITLTIPGPIRKPEEVQVVFNKFTQWLRYTKTSYVWKAEFQERGQVHYHLILNRFLPWKKILYAWNSRLKKAGMLNEWAAKYGHFMPNSCDARSVKMGKGKSLAKYLAKYLSKDLSADPKMKIAKWWGASRNLTTKRFIFEGTMSEHFALDQLSRVDGENFVIWMGDPQLIMSSSTKKRYREWQKSVRDNI